MLFFLALLSLRHDTLGYKLTTGKYEDVIENGSGGNGGICFFVVVVVMRGEA